MKILGGAIPTDKTTGQILLGGQPLVLRSLAEGIHRGIAMVPRKIAVFDHMSVADNIMVASWQHDRRFTISRRATESRASDLMTRWGIDLDLSASVRAMSALQQRELMILRALAASPRYSSSTSRCPASPAITPPASCCWLCGVSSIVAPPVSTWRAGRRRPCRSRRRSPCYVTAPWERGSGFSSMKWPCRQPWPANGSVMHRQFDRTTTLPSAVACLARFARPSNGGFDRGRIS